MKFAPADKLVDGRFGYQYLKLDPPTNSRIIDVGGISLSLTGIK